VSAVKPTVVACAFVPDPDLPPDHQGRRVCARCHLVGRPGDSHHTMPAGPDEDARSLAAGEGGRDSP
jgi:hypothetical protein